ncbi:MAG: GAF domain-containing protein [Bacteroidetes bacterium]|nr:GAF domain-containing protein [Rhodothermia bacterium]MCS7155764.1 GAF domain-containing protein [Bacteroidota bacterium]MCX7906135.1 GAF domain-containing protein [Bacteroidota bacterium]MDW8138263.1 GAF domain-containing protein [Bacteroidota bacterium]MDW8285947.1 GAF domain-containing protein [Bacteroidota bacterium]
MYAFSISAPDKASRYVELYEALEALLKEERDWLANLANTAALLWMALPQINWVGFYLYRGGALVLGPFQGKPACVRIPIGRGVCGTAAAKGHTIRVPDVDAFPGHIACDSASRSEIVVPMRLGSRLLGVLDVDAPVLARFDETDEEGLERVVSMLVRATDWPDSW